MFFLIPRTWVGWIRETYDDGEEGFGQVVHEDRIRRSAPQIPSVEAEDTGFNALSCRDIDGAIWMVEGGMEGRYERIHGRIEGPEDQDFISGHLGIVEPPVLLTVHGLIDLELEFRTAPVIVEIGGQEVLSGDRATITNSQRSMRKPGIEAPPHIEDRDTALEMVWVFDEIPDCIHQGRREVIVNKSMGAESLALFGLSFISRDMPEDPECFCIGDPSRQLPDLRVVLFFDLGCIIEVFDLGHVVFKYEALLIE